MARAWAQGGKGRKRHLFLCCGEEDTELDDIAHATAAVLGLAFALLEHGFSAGFQFFQEVGLRRD